MWKVNPKTLLIFRALVHPPYTHPPHTHRGDENTRARARLRKHTHIDIVDKGIKNYSNGKLSKLYYRLD